MKFHSIKSNTLPVRFNNPFDYEPDALCRAAVKQLQSRLPSKPIEGKMYGVLIVERNGEVGYLQAFSGQMADEGEDFVPAVFDYLQPDGYFKIHEAEITLLNRKIAQLKDSADYRQTQESYHTIRQEAEKAIEEARKVMREAKNLRDKRRKETFVSEVEQREMTRQSQFLKAELQRKKKAYATQITAVQAVLNGYQEQITAWGRERKMKSDRLQRWLFSQFSLLNSRGVYKNLLDIFRDYYLQNSPARTKAAHLASTNVAEQAATESLAASLLPPSGAGECCEPKLLQYAFLHGYKPISMAMFWWGPSPKTEIRQHGNYYPACNGKCKPILEWMLEGIGFEKVRHNKADNKVKNTLQKELKILYEDDYLAVVSKPSGLLSVPGKGSEPSVYSILSERWEGKSEAFMVHRLDMATSGLLVVARTSEVHKALQAQFVGRTVKKKYVALLPLSILDKQLPAEGRIELPLSPDPNDRPRQRVDTSNGKTAITVYRVMGKIVYGRESLEAVKIELCPLTGRTHQLRIHCVHSDGLDTPIIGDNLYGQREERLWLHAAQLEFTHPITQKRMNIDTPL
ncbi:RluA family pseudouridine synthase [Prevotella sp.]